ncbi:hypothetical protein QBC32DRAFT_390279 [Pseudoneurospora amorphoporcata]|uniref:Uncharacterized protein n=1 Tax=Pseudoneurospora amorphoporcata TaxID=241081 RepID=A0AAN6SB03_9PEZI|nr:hypothetical protein QBC32DRAFT_390279 [Pseudoneurospora amorphoporcata]
MLGFEVAGLVLGALPFIISALEGYAKGARQMIENPFGLLWKKVEIYDRIRQRLWRVLCIFEKNVRDINRALEELFRKELKRLSFALNKSAYLELLTRIRDGVSSLEALTSQNLDLEPERNKRSNGRLYRLLHSLSGGIY